MPDSAAASRILNDVGSSHCRPKVMVPRHRRDTCNPVLPKRTCSIPSPEVLVAGWLLGRLRQIPVEDLLAGPEQHAWLRADMLEQPLDVPDPVRDARDIWVQADRHHPRDCPALLVEA